MATFKIYVHKLSEDKLAIAFAFGEQKAGVTFTTAELEEEMKMGAAGILALIQDKFEDLAGGITAHPQAGG